MGTQLRQADQLLSEGKPAEALPIYEAAVNEPPPGHALRGAGLCHEVLGNHAAAMEALEAALKAMPDDAALRLSLARVYSATGKRGDAVTQATHVFQHHPDNLTALIMLGALAETPEQVQQAIDRLDAWRSDPTEKRVAVVELLVALWDLWTRKGDTQAADKTTAQITTAPLGNADAAVLMSGMYVGLDRRATAERLLISVVQAHPTRLDAQRRLAYLAADLGHYALSDQALKHLAADPTKLDETILRARVNVALGQAAEVIAELRDQIAHADRDSASPQRKAQLRYWLGKALMQTDDLKHATTHLVDAVKLWPEMVPAHLALAELRLREGDRAGAIVGLEAALVVTPDAADLYGLLGSAHMTQGDYVRAEAAFRKRADLTPKDANGQHLIGVALLAQKKDAEAHAAFRRALALDPAAVDSIEVLSSALLAENKASEAEALHQRAVSAKPHRIEAWIAFARFYLQVENLTRASAVIQQALRQAPTHVGALEQAAQIALTSRRYVEAEQLTQRLLALSPNAVSALNNLAVLYDEHLNQPDKALDAARKAHALTPNDPHVQDTLGWILHRHGRSQEAVTLLGQSASALSGRAVVLFHYGMALIAADDASAGKTQLRKALAIDPNFSAAEQARAAL